MSCASSVRWAAIERAAIPTKSEFPDADAVFLTNFEQVTFHEVDGKPVADSEVHVVVVVLTEAGRNFGALRAFYSKSFSEILDARARIVRPDGTAKEISRDAMLDSMAVSNSVLYEDSRVLHFTPDTAPIGSVIEYRYTQRHFDPKLFQFSFSFGDFAPVATAEFAVVAPDAWEIEHAVTKYWRPTDSPPEIEHREGMQRLVWRRRSIAALEHEERAPDRQHRSLTVTARLKSWIEAGERRSSFETLADFSKWLYELHRGTADPTQEIEHLAAKVLEGAPDDPRERARRLYEWVQENIRYVAVEVGMGGWKPHPAVEVLKTKYGDCKDKATLLKSLLATVGIDSRLAALFSHDGYPRKFLMPSFGNANHVVLAIDLPGGERVIADPTERTVPFGSLPLRVQEAEILLIDADGAVPFAAPASDARFNTLRTELSVAIDPGGDAVGSWTLKPQGDFAWTLAWETMAKSIEQQKESARGWLSLQKGNIDGVRFDAANELAIGELTVPQVVSRSADARVLRLNELIAAPVEPFREDERTSPVVFRRRERRELSATFAIPDDARWSTLPDPVKLESPFGTFSLVWRLEGAALHAESIYEQSERIVPVERYAELRQFFDEINAALSRGVVIRARAETRRR
jgi:transglutaminase-like putative cysteine protease